MKEGIVGDFFASLPDMEADEPAPKPIKNASELYSEAEKNSVFEQSDSCKSLYIVIFCVHYTLRIFYSPLYVIKTKYLHFYIEIRFDTWYKIIEIFFEYAIC